MTGTALIGVIRDTTDHHGDGDGIPLTIMGDIMAIIIGTETIIRMLTEEEVSLATTLMAIIAVTE